MTRKNTFGVCILKQMTFVLVLLLFFSCSSRDKFLNSDKCPIKPILIPHLGSIGDNDWLHDDNNGIDSVSDNDWVRLQWDILIENDLKTIRVYRFANDLNQAPIKIDSVLWNNTQYIDRFSSVHMDDLSKFNTEWHYFIRVVNIANNYTDSDTVRFTLIQKPLLNVPLHDTVFENSFEIVFKWSIQDISTRMRILLFENDTNRLVWKYDEYVIIENKEYIKVYDGLPLPEGSYSWRVDSRGIADISGIYNSGSKSETRYIHIK